MFFFAFCYANIHQNKNVPRKLFNTRAKLTKFSIDVYAVGKYQ
jgi:hypothetical protein